MPLTLPSYRGVLLLLTLALILTAGLWGETAAAQGSDQAYRVVILTGQSYQEASKGKALLESWHYDPVFVEQQTPGQYRVLYGSFPNEQAAREAMARMQSEGITAREIVQTPLALGGDAQAASGEPVTYSVFLQEFGDEAQAQARRNELTRAGFSPVAVRNVSSFYQVYVGNNTMTEINAVMGKLQQQGYTIPNVSKVVISPAAVPTATPTPRVAAARPDATDANGGNLISQEITQSAIWKQLTADQQREVINSVMMQQELRRGDTMAQQVIDINKRLQNLDERVKTVVQQIEDERTRQNKTMAEITRKTDEAENLIRSGDFQNATMRYREVLSLDPENRYGQKAYIERRLAMLSSRQKGEDFEGQADANQKRYEQLKKEAEQYQRSSNTDDLELARNLWQSIRGLDPVRFGQEASTQINTLSQQIDTLRKGSEEEAARAQKKQSFYLYGLGGGFALLLIVIVVVSLGQQRKQRELMRKMSEFTSQMRPMRELTGGGTPLLTATGGGTGTGSNIFTPRPSGGSEIDALDPLGGLEPEPAPKKKKGKDAAPAVAAAGAASGSDAMDDIFGDLGGGGSATPTAGGGDSFGFDDIFGAPTGQTGQVTAAPTEAGLGDTSFNNLFDAPSAPATSASANAPTPAPAAPSAHDVGPISFDDLVAVSPEPATPSAPADDLMSVFGSIGGEPDSGNGQQPISVATGEATEGLDHLSDSPFSSFMNDLPQTETKPARPVPPVEDDTEIPSIKLDMAGGEPSPATAQSAFSFDFNSTTPEGDQTSTALDLPSFSFDEPPSIPALSTAGAGTAMGATASSMTASFAGVELDFEEDPSGQAPIGWEGEYPFATLLVKADTPPRGAHQYLAFEKHEGSGKALFTYRFPNIQGVIGIEFDLRCNDKNKFLLGFYIEKDGDFQQSVHTKILRSEAQTTPTIHMQGESAPYLLGSWAHIKYVVDLNQGKLNGYIDSTHVARDLPLSPNPGMLNTLSIRDNINTTGILLLDNIKLYQIA